MARDDNSLFARYDYLRTKGLSDFDIMERSGIDEEVLGEWALGGFRLDQDEQRALRNLYQRTVYAEARAAGASSRLASRLSWQTPRTAEVKLNEYGGIVDSLTREAMGPELGHLIETGKDYDIDTLRDKYRKFVIKGMINTNDTLADIKERYGK